MIDFSKSEFKYYDGRLKNIISVASIENEVALEKAFIENRRSAIDNPYPYHHPLKISEIVFKSSPPVTYDFFAIWGSLYRGIAFFVSQPLKEEIEKAKCTGITFTEPNQVYP